MIKQKVKSRNRRRRRFGKNWLATRFKRYIQRKDQVSSASVTVPTEEAAITLANDLLAQDLAQTVEIHDNVSRHFRGPGRTVTDDTNLVRLQLSVPNKSLQRLKNYITLNKA